MSHMGPLQRCLQTSCLLQESHDCDNLSSHTCQIDMVSQPHTLWPVCRGASSRTTGGVGGRTGRRVLWLPPLQPGDSLMC